MIFSEKSHWFRSQVRTSILLLFPWGSHVFQYVAAGLYAYFLLTHTILKLYIPEGQYLIRLIIFLASSRILLGKTDLWEGADYRPETGNIIVERSNSGKASWGKVCVEISWELHFNWQRTRKVGEANKQIQWGWNERSIWHSRGERGKAILEQTVG